MGSESVINELKPSGAAAIEVLRVLRGLPGYRQPLERAKAAS